MSIIKKKLRKTLSIFFINFFDNLIGGTPIKDKPHRNKKFKLILLIKISMRITNSILTLALLIEISMSYKVI